MSGAKAQNSREFWLNRNLALAGALILAVAGGTLGHLYRSTAVENLERMVTQNNLLLTRAFTNSLWPRFSSFFRSDNELTREELRSHPQTGELRREVMRLMSGTGVVKVKIHDLDGLTVFSTDLRQVGARERTNPGFLSARNGRVASELTNGEPTDAADGTRAPRDVVASFIPIYGAGSARAIEGVLEIHSDVTSLRQQALWHKVSEEVSANRFLLLLMFVFLLYAIHRAERIMNRQRRNDARLAANVAQAEFASRLLANMSHELRTPLNAIIGFSEMMKDDILGPVNNPRYKRYAVDIHVSGQHLLRIVNDILDMAKIESGAFELSEHELDIGGAVEASLRLVKDRAEKGSLTLSAEIPGNLPLLRADRRLMRHILLNLLTNAVRFTPEGGKVTVKAGMNAAGALWIAVTDTGLGMPEDQIAKALQPFGQLHGSLSRRYRGTGLGLPLVKRFVEVHGGALEVLSEVEAGTTAMVKFPRERVIQPDDVPQQTAVEAAAAGRPCQDSARPEDRRVENPLRLLPGVGAP